MSVSLMILTALFLSSTTDSTILYTMPEESALHEGTWLQ